MARGYVLLIIPDLADGIRIGERAIELASSKGLDLVVAYIFKREVAGCLPGPSIRKGVGDHIALIYTFSEKRFHEELRRANQVLEKIINMAIEKNVRTKIIHAKYGSLKSLLQQVRNAEHVVVGYSRYESFKIVEKIKNVARDIPLLIA
ncbi:MAG: hypothetical protein QW724_06075 [Nitrososphaerota archaeon]